jgi:uncharacterized protein (TIGR02996 family)
MASVVDLHAAFLAALVPPGDDPATRLAYADFLDEAGPTPVLYAHLPNWLRLAWVGNRPPGGRQRYGSRAGWAVSLEIEEWLHGIRHVFEGRLDHWGSTRVAGLLCFVNEPYSRPEAALDFLRPLAGYLRCPLAFARRANLAECDRGRPVGGLCRVLLFPPLPIPEGGECP